MSTTVKRMPTDNPFHSLGYRWLYKCTECNTTGGAATRKQAEALAANHDKTHDPKPELRRS